MTAAFVIEAAISSESVVMVEVFSNGPFTTRPEIRGVFGCVAATHWLAAGAAFRILEQGNDNDETAAKEWRENLRFDVKRTDGEAVRWLSIQKWRDTSNNEDDRAEGRPQSLVEHQYWTAKRALRLARCLGLPKSYRRMLAIAARLHDEGPCRSQP